MTKIEYLRRLHDIAYQANLADTEHAEGWQRASMASAHVNPILDIVESMMSPPQYQMFLDCFGDFASIVAGLREEA
jgi:hypothetical protein